MAAIRSPLRNYLRTPPPDSRILVVGYVRVSDREQIEGLSLPAQRAKIKQWAALFDSRLLTIFADPGKSGRSRRRREGLAAALALAKLQRATLVVYSLDRLARNTEDTLALCRELLEAGSNVVSVAEHLDTTSAFGRWAFRSLASNAELESDRIGERVRFALEHKRQERKRWWGGKAAPYGWKLAADKSHVVQDRAEQAVIAKMRRWRRESRSYGWIANRLHELGIRTKTGKRRWQRMTIKKVLEIDLRMRAEKRNG